MSLQTTLRQTLEDDATLAGLLTGGVFDASELPDDGLTPGMTGSPWGSDGVLQPCAVIRWRGQNPFGPHWETGSERIFVEVYLYGMRTSIDSAADRLNVLLNAAILSADSRNVRIKKAGGALEVPTPELGNVNGRMCRFQAVRVQPS